MESSIHRFQRSVRTLCLGTPQPGRDLLAFLQSAHGRGLYLSGEGATLRLIANVPEARR